MTEQNPLDKPLPPGAPADAQIPGAVSGEPGAIAPRPRVRRRRRWPAVLGIVVLLLIVLVLLLPTIASTGPVRGYILARVNQNLNGRVQVDDWSLGWGGNLRLDGLRVFDNSGAQILQLSHVAAHPSVWDVIRGKYYLGKIVVDGLDFVAVRESDGTLNFERLAKSEPKGTVAAKPEEKKSEEPKNPVSQPPSEAKASAQKLPDLQVELVLQNCRGTIEDRQTNQTAYLRSLDGDINIPDINAPVTETIKAVIALGQNQPGTFSMDGKTLLVKNNKVMTDPAEITGEGDIEQKIALTEMNLASLAPFLGRESGIQQIAGIANGQISVNLKPGQSGAIDGHVTVTDLRAGGPALKGDTLAASSADILISPITIEVPRGKPGVENTRIITGAADGKQPITITLVQGPGSTSRITLFANVTPRSLSNLANRQKPGDAGRIEADTDIDVGHLAVAMPHLFEVSRGVSPTSGRLRESTVITLTPDKCDFQNHFALAPVTLARGASSSPATEPVLTDYSLAFDAAGTIVAAGGNQSISFSQLDLSDNQNYLSIKKSADAILIGLAPGGALYPTGKIEIASDLKALNDLLRRLAPPTEKEPPQLAVKTDQGVAVRSGKLSGTVAFAPGADRHFLLSTQMQIAGLTIEKAAATPLQDEKLTLLLDATVRDDVSQVQVGRFDITGSLLTAHAEKMVVQLKQGEGKQAVTVAPLLMIQQANLAVDVPSLPKVQAALDAFSPPRSQAQGLAPLAEVYAAAREKVVPSAATDPPAGAQTKLNLTSGGVALNVVVSNDGKQLILAPRVTGRNIAFEAVAPGRQAVAYSCEFVFDQEIAIGPDQQHAKGVGDVTDFAMHEGQAVSFSEPKIHIGDNVEVAGQKLSINELSLAMQTSNALNLSVKGAVADFQHKRELENIAATLTYDLAKLWKIAYPMLSPADRESLKDVQMAGQFTKTFTASGSYPADVASNVALRSLHLQGGLAIASLTGKGLDLRNFELPIWGNAGIFLVAYSDKPGDYPQPASCNGGQLSISGATLDLTSDHPRLTMIPGTVAMRNIALNPALASAMGESLGNILFAGASSASGQATLTINQCNRLPLDNLVSQRTLENDGMLDMAASVSDVELGSPNINKAASGLSSALQLVNARIDPGFVKSLRGSIKNYTIKIQKGVTTHDMLMSFTESDRPLHLTGTMGLEKKDLNMALELPWALLGMNDKVVTGAMPGGIQIPVSGTATAPRFNVNEVIQKNLLQKGPQNILKNLPGLFNRDKGNQGQ